ncbi:MAG: hypothetical protein ACRDLK_08075 [Gaiellaceae bacterium]
MSVLLAVFLALAGGLPHHNGRVAFVRCCGPTGIYSIAPGGGAQKLLFRPAADDAPLEPAWSPNGKLIAYTPGNGIWVMRANGSHRHRVAKTGTEPAWSEDGRKLVFSDRGDIWLVRATGGGLTRLTRAKADEFRPAWAPDDSEILYARGNAIWRMGKDGRGQHRLIRNASDPAWSPGATHVAFLRGDVVWIAKRSGTGARPVPGATGVAQFAWSPDGRLLVTAPVDRGDLTVMATDGSGARPLTGDSGDFHAWPAWQPVR